LFNFVTPSQPICGPDTEQEKRATCERLKSARGAVFLIVFLAAPFSNRFVRCLVPV
jgi:hypothetical protein